MRRGITVTGVILVVFATVSFVVAPGSSIAMAPFKPIAPSQIDQSEVDKARRIAETTLTNWREGKFEPRGAEFTDAMKKASTPAKQKKAYQSIKKLFGDFQSLKFAEAVASKDAPGLILYRFRGKFSETDDKPEIRVVINKEGKVAGFWIKPWLKIVQ